jgi:phosphotransferase system IIB component
MQIRKSTTTQPNRKPTAIAQLALEKVMNLSDNLTSLQADVTSLRAALADHSAAHTAHVAALAQAIDALDTNLRATAEAIGGLRSDLAPRTAIGKLLAQLLIGGGQP